MHLLNADLHCHSHHSDGALSPAELAHRAHAAGVQLWSLTDHDDLGGQAQARQAAQALGMDYVCGVEISVSFAGETVHVLGLDVDPTSPSLVQGLATMRNGRDARAQEMGRSLAAVGIHGAYEGALVLAGGQPQQLSRTHFARFLVAQGHCASMQEVFSRFMKAGKPGFVPHRWAGLGQTLGWIRDAGGVAVLAHPARYPFNPTLEWALFEEFKGHGGIGVEVTCGSHFPDEVQRYADMAQEFSLLASRGSDFHAPQESRVDLGDLPDLPSRVTPVWTLWADRLRHRTATPGWALSA
ncbi:PHP domain-containing protein [Ideonella livida]|uniref:PHP domain-containing protein n=1 Tax=Ideonella livida TaxID=2707176 RepID=A0A7C9PFU7_9BURK|nr:PHP domain-containing protein [Ideonella livida]NDY90648.1 PHP domain-containing protein [Ideonella livida]